MAAYSTLPQDVTVRDEDKESLELQLWERPFDGRENHSLGFVTISWTLRAYRLGGSRITSVREFGVHNPGFSGRGWKSMLVDAAIAHLRDSTK